jgi:hypothetical protein
VFVKAFYGVHCFCPTRIAVASNHSCTQELLQKVQPALNAIAVLSSFDKLKDFLGSVLSAKQPTECTIKRWAR